MDVPDTKIILNYIFFKIWGIKYFYLDLFS